MKVIKWRNSEPSNGDEPKGYNATVETASLIVAVGHQAYVDRRLLSEETDKASHSPSSPITIKITSTGPIQEMDGALACDADDRRFGHYGAPIAHPPNTACPAPRRKATYHNFPARQSFSMLLLPLEFFPKMQTICCRRWPPEGVASAARPFTAAAANGLGLPRAASVCRRIVDNSIP